MFCTMWGGAGYYTVTAKDTNGTVRVQRGVVNPAIRWLTPCADHGQSN